MGDSFEDFMSGFQTKSATELVNSDVFLASDDDKKKERQFILENAEKMVPILDAMREAKDSGTALRLSKEEERIFREFRDNNAVIFVAQHLNLFDNPEELLDICDKIMDSNITDEEYKDFSKKIDSLRKEREENLEEKIEKAKTKTKSKKVKEEPVSSANKDDKEER